MVQTLALNQVSFGFPLFVKSFSLFVLANRAISLITIFFVKGMSILAMSFSSVKRADTPRIVKRVFSRGHQSQVRRVHAVSMTAKMVDEHTIRYRTDSHKICDTMSTPVSLFEVKTSIAVLVQRRLPKIATVLSVGNNIFTSKPLFFRISYIHVPIVPCLTLRGNI